MLLYQHDKVRAAVVCPNCLEAKQEGLLLCWPCHHSQKRFNNGNYSDKCQRKIAAMDIRLGGPLDQAKGYMSGK